MSTKHFLITGCGRSGTKFISELFRSFGLDVRHERRGSDGAVCWYCCLLFQRNIHQNTRVIHCGCQFKGVRVDTYGSASSDYSTPSLRDHYGLVLHQLRSPMEVIASVQTITDRSLAYIDNKIGVRQYDDRIMQAARYWVEWNKAAYRVCDYSYKIEDLRWQLPKLCELIGVSCPVLEDEGLFSRRTNSRPHAEVSVNYIKERDVNLYQDLVETAEFFHYPI